MFTKIDANLNNIEGLVIDIYPALYLYPKGFKEFLYDFGMSNIKSFNPIPTWLRPHLENAMNYSFFRDAPILPADAPKDMLNQYYSTEYNNQAIKKLKYNQQ